MNMLNYEFTIRDNGPPIPDLSTVPILVVGAGGIGCELLKTLALSGFTSITVCDLDTIDVSNLNRQFLFRKRHVGTSKAETAVSVVREFNPAISYKAKLGNIKDEEFDAAFFEGFVLVLNALDNVNARQHVNRMCLAANVPMIDAGTTGYLGQTVVVKKGETKCYDCDPKREANAQKFPICTIRSTPDKPVHCIVWAKELFKLAFGAAAESDLVDLKDSTVTASSAATSQIDTTKSAVMKAVLENRPTLPEQVQVYVRGVFEAVFTQEIKQKLEMRDGYKGATFKPKPLDYDLIFKDESITPVSAATNTDGPRRLWTLKECLEQFTESTKEILMNRKELIGSLSFDKDDEVAMRFVTAASNLRSHVFGIERKSLFDVKGIAGNIIHAIATTNAIVAGIQVLEAIRLLRHLHDKDDVTKDNRFVWVNRLPTGTGFLLQPVELEKPNKECVACGRAEQQLYIDFQKCTLGDVVKTVLQGRLGVNSPMISLGSSVLYETGQGLDSDEIAMYERNSTRTLENCPGGGIREGSSLSIQDCFQNLNFNLVFHHRAMKVDPITGEVKGEMFELTGEPPKVKEAAGNGTVTEKEDEDESVIEILPDLQDSAGKKRKAESVEASPSNKKRNVQDEDSDVEVLE